MSVYSGDFLGFSLGDTHSSRLNITRVSSGDRYTDGLIPTFTDSTIVTPGGDGTYYWDTFYTQKTFTIDFAFDDLRDEDLRALRQLFAFKGVQPLIFDEFPYKKYYVKSLQPPQIKFIPFDYLEFRIYKGEGSVQLVAYYPYAFGVVTPKIAAGTTGPINNVGDIPANLDIYYSLDAVFNGVTINNKDEKGNILSTLQLKAVEPIDGDTYIVINTKNYLIEGLDENFERTGTLYNKYISAGDFFHPPVGRSFLQSTVAFEKAIYTPLYY